MTGIGWKEKAPHLGQKTWKREIQAKKSTVLTGEQFWVGGLVIRKTMHTMKVLRMGNPVTYEIGPNWLKMLGIRLDCNA